MQTIPLTPVQLPSTSEFWRCQESGDCCSIPAEVVMTNEERALIATRLGQNDVLSGVATHWRVLGHGKVALKAHPCPFYLFNTCAIYDIRPFNCRRFACMRPDPKTEPFVLVPHGYGDLSGQCANVITRLMSSKVARKLAKRVQKSARKWAREHGWK